ncbi:MerR family transcriptional regulator [Rossellomorea vietnamensis]|uniref:MerR family transcriptional regulator n=1 Tax=Rossellomorea vietnamensis TaxID=218284 RepID=A0A5D4NX78_9BACI|nr:MerR family transcriptional regulator [Rossellomorea vietnamensis]TYS18965.1 MerR family transcriptional regulator [Rossellomorea vietnamensis]
MTQQSEGKYNIKAISKMLGIQPGTLRAWERRYKMIAPVRNESGHRLYSEEHLRVLKWLVGKVEQGFTISQAVSLLDKQGLTEETDTASPTGNRVDDLTEELMQSLLKFDESKAHQLMNRAFSMYTIDKVVIDVLGTLLVRIGDLWEHNQITTAHEHFATAVLRARISNLMQTFPHNGLLPKVVAVCGPNEHHELGLLMFTLYVRRKGFEVIYLGSSIKEEDMEVVIDTVKPRFLFLSCTMRENIDQTLGVIDQLQKTKDFVHVGIGGLAVNSLPQRIKEAYKENLVGSSKEDWDSWLKTNL